MRIAVIAPPWIRIPPPAYGGIEAVVGLLTEGLVSAGHDVTLFASGDSRTSAKLISFFSRAQTGKLGDRHVDLYHVGAAYDLCRQQSFDIIHDHTNCTGVVIGAYSRTPVLSTVHGAFTERTKPIYWRFRERLYYNAVSEYQRRLFSALRYVPTVYNTIDFAQYEVQAEKRGYLLALGRISRKKGTHIAIAAAKKLGKPLVIAGKIDPGVDREYFLSKIKPEIDGHRIKYLGEVPWRQKIDLMAGAECFVFPIEWDEPFGLVMVEAMASGTPVAAYNRGAVEEVVLEGTSGYIAADFDELVEKINVAHMIEPSACRSYAERTFPIKRMVDGYIANYRYILDAEGSVNAGSLTLAQPS